MWQKWGPQGPLFELKEVPGEQTDNELKLEASDKPYRNGDSQHLEGVGRSHCSISFHRRARGPGRGAGSLRVRQIFGEMELRCHGQKAAWPNPGLISWPLPQAGAPGGHRGRVTSTTSAALNNSANWSCGLDTVPPGGSEAPVRGTSFQAVPYASTEGWEGATESVL